MSRNIPTEWRKNEREVDTLSGDRTAIIRCETFWYEESMSAPYGMDIATDTWMEMDDSVEPRWFIDGPAATREQVVALIGEEETDKTLAGE